VLSTRAHWLLVLTAIAAAAPRARADGGQVQYSGTAGPYRVTVFTQPVPLRAGPADFSVLVQDPRTGDVLLDGSVRIDVVALDPPGATIPVMPSRAAATNKLLRAAMVHLPAGGKYHALVVVAAARGAAQAEFNFEAAPALPPWRSLLPWLLWPAVPIALYVWYTVAAAQTTTRRSAAPEP
jgi:hypothetical protein